MSESILIGFALVVFLGILAQWLAWRLHIPSIFLLLVFGFIAGPVTGILNPDAMFGELLFPVVSIAVGIILFEGGLGLRLQELDVVGTVVRNLITIGALVTWGICALAAYTIVGLDLSLSLLLGAILIVSGPTVILPLMRDIRPIGQVGSVLRWEGILIDPIGATMAVIVYDAILESNVREAAGEAVVALLQIIIIGAAVGWAGAWLLSKLLQRYLIPDHLQNAFTLMVVVTVFVLSSALAQESGLLATTVMGMVLSNQRTLPLKRIIEFKEDLGVLLVSSLFILLTARLQIGDLLSLGWPALVFLAVIILVARPLMVFVSTFRSNLKGREKLFLASLAPRGIIAAAVSSIFAIELSRRGYPGADALVPLTFLVISGTVVIYGLTAGPLARRLGLAEDNPQGTLIVGAHGWARALAQYLQGDGYKVLLADTNATNVKLANAAGLKAECSNILYEDVVEELDLGGVGRLLALTSNEEVNSMATLHLAEVFGRSNVYQVRLGNGAGRSTQQVPQHLRGRFLFGTDISYRELEKRFAQGWFLQTFDIAPGVDFRKMQEEGKSCFLPLFLKDDLGSLQVFTSQGEVVPQPGDEVIALIAPGETIEMPIEPEIMAVETAEETT